MNLVKTNDRLALGEQPINPVSGGLLGEDGVQTLGGARAPFYPGLTKREHFAALALPVAFAFFDEGYCGDHDWGNAQSVAEVAVAIADALLAELAKGESAQLHGLDK